MKWETAKTWLIMAFIFLDIVLGWQVYAERQTQVAYVESYSDVLANTKTLLSEHGLVLDVTVPQSHDKMNVLRGVFSQPSLQGLASAAFPGDRNIGIDETAAQAKLKAGTVQMTDIGTWQVNYSQPLLDTLQSPSDILKYVWQGNQYTLDAAVNSPQNPDKSGPRMYNFYEKYQSYPIFDATISAQVSQAKLLTYTQTSVGALQTVGSSKTTISALDALDSLANSIDQLVDKPGSKILSIQMGYAHKVAGDSAPDTSTTAANYWFPVWRIVTTQTIYFVNAFTGEVNVPSK